MFADYKNYIYVAIFLSYSFFVWHVSSKVTENTYLTEKTLMQQELADKKQQKQDVADSVGKVVENALQVYQQNQNKKQKELLDEIRKAPVYHDCINTPDVVQSLTDARNRANEAIGK
jgi:MFS superfamily sulfate permease-like transporter